MAQSKTPTPATVSKKILLPYQQRWVADKSPLKIWNKSRQVGFSFAGAFEAVVDCLSHKTLWIFLSKGQRQARELTAKGKDHCHALAKVEASAAGVELLDSKHWGFYEGAEILQEELRFPNGSRVIALPANPDTARGYSGNVLLDEFALHKDAKAIYAGVFPSITRGYKIRIGSTPFGESGMFYELFTKGKNWSKHETTIYQAKEDGLEVDIELLREGCPDEDTWLQEYCCKFISDATSWIPWDQILGAESVDATLNLPEGFVPSGEIYLGSDIGRKKDLTVFVVLEKIGDVKWVRGVIVMRGAKFEAQRQMARNLIIGLKARRYCQDASGLGMQLAEQLQTEFGSKVEPITFTVAVKEDLAVRVRREYEQKTIRTPEDREFRADVHSVRRYPSTGGHFRFDAERTEAGHADRFWALSLGLLAASGPNVSTDFIASSRPRAFAEAAGY